MPSQFLQARTCYDHLAGEAAVLILQAMLKARWLTEDTHEYEITRLGQRKLAEMGIEAREVRQGRRTFARGCVDLTQRRPHLAGALGAALLEHYVREKWVLRTPRSRVVSVTPKGRTALKQLLGVTV
jgi:hypothetical protein